ncbi:MAG: RNA polymerase sigma-70 factor [Ignavibacteriaceae bacterium]
MHIGKNIIDDELLFHIKQNDSKAFDILFKRYYHRLCSFSFQFVKNTELAEEVVSDVFLNIWLKKGEIEIRSSLKAYLYIAVRNQSLNYLKRKCPYFEDLAVVDKENKISKLTADHFLHYEDLKDEIESIIQKLPEKRQLIFRMNRFDGLSYKEIADILSISVNTVQNQMVKAVRFLSDQYPRLKKLF